MFNGSHPSIPRSGQWFVHKFERLGLILYKSVFLKKVLFPFVRVSRSKYERTFTDPVSMEALEERI